MNVYAKKNKMIADSNPYKAPRSANNQKRKVLNFFRKLSYERNVELKQFSYVFQNLSHCRLTGEEYMGVIKNLSKYVAYLRRESKRSSNHKAFTNIHRITDLVGQYWSKNGDEIIKDVVESDLLDIDTFGALIEFHGRYNFRVSDKAAEIFKQKIETVLKGATLEKLSFIIESAAKVKLPLPLSFQSILLEKIRNSSQSLNNPRFIVVLTWSCAMLDSIFPGEYYRKMGKLLHKPCRKTLLSSVGDKHRMRDASFWFGWEQKDLSVRKNPKSSILESALCRFFNRAGYETKQPKGTIPFLKQAIDLTVFRKDQKNGCDIHIELDGPGHYLKTGKASSDYVDLNGNTVFRSALMNKAAPNLCIVRIPYGIAEIMVDKDREYFSSHEQRSELAHWFMNKSSQLAPGVYHLQFGKADINDKDNVPLTFDKIAGDIPSKSSQKNSLVLR